MNEENNIGVEPRRSLEEKYDSGEELTGDEEMVMISILVERTMNKQAQAFEPLREDFYRRWFPMDRWWPFDTIKT